MSTIKAIADDYYVNGLSNAEIFNKHDLEMRKPTFFQERVYEYFPAYVHEDLCCNYCGGAMESSYVGKGARLAKNKLTCGSVSKEIQSQQLVRVEGNLSGGVKRRSSGSAYLVDGGHRISAPTCTQCGHQLKDHCSCDSCIADRNDRALAAAELTHSELMSIEPIVIKELQCKEMMKLLQQLSGFASDLTTVNYLSRFERLDFEKKLTLMLLGAAEVSVESVLPAIKMVSNTEYSVAWKNVKFGLKNAQALSNSFMRVKHAAINQVRSDIGSLRVLETWESLAHEEAISVLEYYCERHDIVCCPGDQTNDAIARSLNRYGLALTSRYLYSSVWSARKYASEQGYDNHRAFSFIYGSLNFWIEDPRARTYTARPFRRTENVLSEPEAVAIFSKFFLEQNGVNYFSDPICLASLKAQDQLD